MEATATHKPQPTWFGWPQTLPLQLGLSNRLGVLALVFALTGLALLPCDLLLVRWTRHLEMNSELCQLLTFTESFAHGLGAMVILLTCAVLIHRQRRRVWLVAGMAFSAGGIADLLKLTIHRMRPTLADDVAHITDTFVGMGLTGDDAAYAWDYLHQSFPSAHTATAFALACGLGWLLGRAHGYFLFLALLASLQRIVTAAHFPSDVMFGAALGVFMASLLLKSYGPAPYLRRWLTGTSDI
jgi:membrane-associated phospholipid phosphatase